MKLINLYRVLSIILIPIAMVLGFMDIILLMMGFSANPAILFVAFAIACLVIYAIASIRFLIVVVGGEKNCKKSLKDWIKVNAYGTLFIAGMFLLNAIGSALMSEPNLRVILNELMLQQPEFAAYGNIDLMLSMFRIVTVTMFVISVVTIGHVAITFNLLKKYDHFFASE
jgi:hypothetical protein